MPYQNTEDILDTSFVNKMKEDHPAGTPIVLLHLNNVFFQVTNRKGKVLFVDEAGCVHVEFGKGNVVPLNYRFGDRWQKANG